MKKTCDLCKEENLVEYFDGKVLPMLRQWANMCPKCWKARGIGKLGTGLAQHYKWDADKGHYIKIGG